MTPKKPVTKKTRRGTVTTEGGPDRRIVGNLGQLEKISKAINPDVKPWLCYYHGKRR